MRVVVNMETCDGHGQCTFAAPDVFELDDVGELHYVEHPDDAHRQAVENAARLCPVQAIAIEA